MEEIKNIQNELENLAEIADYIDTTRDSLFEIMLDVDRIKARIDEQLEILERKEGE